ncbi:protein preY, mitochondrial [Gossypium australe]|uniref:Protein preY, mitochondrial n=1 Tax=Gossypium australe TaxID=47621 RepID=A0A5B6W018_9ROSI|nr:protein preY, mitochondrial [Gossypium australe]
MASWASLYLAISMVLWMEKEDLTCLSLVEAKKSWAMWRWKKVNEGEREKVAVAGKSELMVKLSEQVEIGYEGGS